MKKKVMWGDEFVRFEPVKGAVLDGDGQKAQAAPVTLTAGRNGVADFQLIVGPVAGSASVTVSGGTLSGPGKAKLGASQFDVYVEWYHRLDKKWYPDALVPQKVTGGSTPAFRQNVGIKGSSHAGFWVDLFVPGNARPGVYEGKVTVKVDDERFAVPVSLTVCKARILAGAHLDMSLNNYVDAISGGWRELRRKPGHLATAKYRRVEQGVFRAAHEHRGFIHYMPYGHSGYLPPEFAPPLTGEGPRKRVTSWTEWDRHFGPYFDGSAFKNTRRGAIPIKRFYLPLNLHWPADFVKFDQPGYEAEWRAVGKQMVDHFREKKWTKTHFDLFLNHKQRFRFFPWDCEEVKYLPDNDLQRRFRKLWEGTFDRKSTKPVKFDYTLGTTWVYEDDIYSDLSEFIDVYIANTGGPAGHPQRQAELVEQGRAIWSCTHSGGIPDSTRAAAYTPLLMYMRNLQGFMPRWASLAWGADAWHQTPDMGMTTFIYPGSEFGTDDAYPSMRLKSLRNSQQMIDAFELAAKRMGRKKVQSSANRILGMKSGAWFETGQGKRRADWGSVEAPVSGWSDISTTAWRKLRAKALELASR